MPGGSNSLDIGHLAEEIEDLGKRDVREIQSLVRQMLLHSLKVGCDRQFDASRHGRSEIIASQADARRAFAPSMRQRIDVGDVWREAVRAFMAWCPTNNQQSSLRVAAVLEDCPVSLDDLVASNFDGDATLDRVGASPVRSAIDG